MLNGNQAEARLADLLLPIEGLFGELDGLLDPADAVSLRQSHKSVLLSFGQMLDYIHGIGEPKQGEIARLLHVYREMAKKFYTQYEFSLLREIRAQREIQAQSEQVIARIRDLKVADADNNTLRMAIPLVEKAGVDAALEYQDLLKNYPTLMQQALDKLKDEWQRLYAIVTASAALTEDETLLRTLTAVATAAAISVGMEPGQILIVPGNVFALYFFSYLEKIAVLTVPIYSMRAPWEWSIFWHELAGYKVSQLENDTIINEIRIKLTRFYERYKLMEQSEKTKWLEVAARHRPDLKDMNGRKNEFTLNYLNQVFSGNQANLRDLGGFEHQFDQLLARVTRKNKFQSYEQMKKEGWSVSWFQELFEDAYSVIAIREPFLVFFQNILSRHAVTDERHPPPHVRLSVAKELLNLMDPKSKIVNNPRLVEKAAAEQILKFMSLLMVTSPILDAPESNAEPASSLVQFRDAMFLYDFPEHVGTKIGASIENWAANILQSNTQAKSRVRSAEDLIKEFSDQELAGTIAYLKEENQIRPIYELLLAGRDYKQLLALSFYKRDFFSSKGITNVFYNKNGVASSQPIFRDTSDTDFIIDAFGLLARTVSLPTEGEITFEFGPQKWATTRSNWNNAFPENSPFPNIKKYHIA